MTKPLYIEGVVLYAAAGYLAARDVLCAGVVQHLLPVCVVGVALTAYCALRAVWCARMQVMG